jgi:LacI family transcriptional regulator
MTKTTIFDIADLCGVSYATVSRVINNNPNVKPETRQRILDTMQRLGFVANRQARSLAGGQSHSIGILAPRLDTSYMGEIIRGIESELVQADYDLLLYTTQRREAKESTFVARLTQGLADGLLLVLPRNPGALLPMLRQRQMPCVLVDHQGLGEQSAAVGAQNRQGAYAATKYLIQLGHRRIGFITGVMDMGCTQDRLTGYKAALSDHSLAVDEALICEGDFYQPRGYACAAQLLAHPAPPTAIFASNDLSAFGAMEAIREHGLRIPEDISVIGFDDIPQAAQVHPPLTTVQQPLEEMGRVACRMLLELIQNPQRPMERVELPTQLVVRHSCRRIAGLRR